jgi:multicomponent Na+:H+ antiporter subunit C
MIEILLGRGPYLLVVLLAVVGTYLMMSRRTLLKAVVGLYVFQTSTILLFVALSYRAGATVPIVLDERPMHNPLPHAMMLTAIVVGVATVGVAVAILRRIQSESGSIEDTGG